MMPEQNDLFRVAHHELQALVRSHGRTVAVQILSGFGVTRLYDLKHSQLPQLISRVRLAAAIQPTEAKPMDDYKFFFVASQKRLENGTPYMRERFATEKEAITCASEWAAKSEHGGKYIVYNVTAVGEAQRAEPPVKYRKIRARK